MDFFSWGSLKPFDIVLLFLAEKNPTCAKEMEECA